MASDTAAATSGRRPNAFRPPGVSPLTARTGPPSASLLRRQIGDDVLPILLVLQPGEDHLRVRHRLLRIGEIGVERLVVPGLVRLLHRVGIIEVGDATGMAADDAVEAG